MSVTNKTGGYKFIQKLVDVLDNFVNKVRVGITVNSDNLKRDEKCCFSCKKCVFPAKNAALSEINVAF